VLTLVLSHSQGDVARPRPHTREGAQVGSARDDEAAFSKGAMGGGKRDSDGRAAARHGCGYEDATGRDDSGGCRGGGDRGGVGVANACSRRG
jgi:hypothetical protein